MNRTKSRRLRAAVSTIGLLIQLVFSDLALAAEVELHDWVRITYPHVEIGESKTQINFLVTNEDQLKGLRFDILISGGSRVPERFADRVIKASIVRENGSISEPLDGNPLNPVGGAGSASGLTWSTMTSFPWGANRLDAAWIGVEFGEQVVWLELPYGFDRDPTHPLSPAKQLEVPVKPESIGEQNVIHWKEVYYDFGKIQNDWRLSLRQSNPFDAMAEVVLYRDDSAVGKSIFLWNLHKPRTNARIHENGGGMIGGMCRELRLHDDGMRRSDIYRFSRNVKRGRSWGEIEIDVGAKRYRKFIPSSVFRNVHGHSRDKP